MKLYNYRFLTGNIFVAVSFIPENSIARLNCLIVGVLWLINGMMSDLEAEA